MIRNHGIRFGAAIWIVLGLPGAARASQEAAPDILKATGVQGGLIVHVGCGDGKLTAELRVDDRYLVHGLDPSQADRRPGRGRF